MSERDPLIEALRAAGAVPAPPDPEGALTRALDAVPRPGRLRRVGISLIAAALLVIPAGSAVVGSITDEAPAERPPSLVDDDEPDQPTGPVPARQSPSDQDEDEDEQDENERDDREPDDREPDEDDDDDEPDDDEDEPDDDDERDDDEERDEEEEQDEESDD